jgi:transcriptional regulator with XRE-family HTH domain
VILGDKIGSDELKALIRETSVYKHVVELKEDALTEQGFFDLAKVLNLRLAGTGKFLKNLRIKKRLSQTDIANIVNVYCWNVSRWERNVSKIPIQSLIKIAETLEIEEIREIIKYLVPQTSNSKTKRVTLKKCSNRILQQVKNTFNVIPRTTRTKRGPFTIIISSELHTFLKTFFRYKKIYKIRFPLTNEVKFWKKTNIDLIRAVIIPCLQTDGCIAQSSNQLIFTGKSKYLHNIFVDAMNLCYSVFPITYFLGTSSVPHTIYSRTISINEINNLAGNTKTNPTNGQSVEEYKTEPQPKLNYLLDSGRTEKKIALRLWITTEGSISIHRFKKLIYPELELSCTHPDLIFPLKRIAKQFNINFTIVRSKRTWSGFAGLLSNSIKNVIAFLKIGGFFPSVKVSYHSKYHQGIDKDVYLLGILEFIKRQKSILRLRKLTLDDVHIEINRIIENELYSTDDYYINYFS